MQAEPIKAEGPPRPIEPPREPAASEQQQQAPASPPRRQPTSPVRKNTAESESTAITSASTVSTASNTSTATNSSTASTATAASASSIAASSVTTNGTTNGQPFSPTMNHAPHNRSPHGPPRQPPMRSPSGGPPPIAPRPERLEHGEDSYGARDSVSIFSVRNGEDLSHNRRATRRRTGPLSAAQREKAALIRKLGACGDCRRRRVACHPNHHNMTWEDAMRKFSSVPSPDLPATAVGGPLSQSPNGPIYHEPQSHEMDVDSGPPAVQPPGRPVSSDSNARIRTPLPSGPSARQERPMPLQANSTNHHHYANSLPPLPPPAGLVHGDLQAAASRIFSSPHRSRYAAVQVMILYWQDDEDKAIKDAINELAAVLDKAYRYTFDLCPIPLATESCKSPLRWLSRKVNDFIEHRDSRDVLKIVFYVGDTFLDSNREMVLSSIKYRDSGSVIRWNGIQPAFEDAVADVLIIMDGAYFPSPDVMRKRDGVLELISPTTSAAHMAVLGRASFTHWLSEQLRARAKEGSEPLTICELYERLLSLYSKQHRDFQQAVPETMPMPLHIRAGAARFMPIGLQPVDADSGGARLHKVSHGLKDMRLSINIALNDNEPSNMDSWIEWLRLMPDGVRDVKVDGPYQQPSYR